MSNFAFCIVYCIVIACSLLGLAGAIIHENIEGVLVTTMYIFSFLLAIVATLFSEIKELKQKTHD